MLVIFSICPVQIRLSRGRFYYFFLASVIICHNFMVGSVQRVNIYRHSQTMLGNLVRMRYEPEIKAG